MSTHTEDENKNESNEPNEQAPELTKEEQLTEELGKVRNEYLYLRAEFDNFRKQSIKERSDLLKYGAERFVTALLDVVDNFDRALEVQVTPVSFDRFQEGVRLTHKELNSVLDKFGVQAVDPQGEPFNPSVHEALSSEETDQVEAGHIFRVFKKAFKLHDKVIRPAQVVVAKEPSN